IAPHNGAEAERIVAAYFDCGAAIGINADLALGQACHECAWFILPRGRPRRWVMQRNPCGLEVTSDDAPGATFASAPDPPVIRGCRDSESGCVWKGERRGHADEHGDRIRGAV